MLEAQDLDLNLMDSNYLSLGLTLQEFELTTISGT